MKFRLYKEFGALNSQPIFSAFEQGIIKLGHTISNDADAIPVIWSVLWRGRMFPNRNVYNAAKKNQLPVVIIEVGNLKRNYTWRIGIDNINNLGFFENNSNLDHNRPKKLGIFLKDFQLNRKPEILIAGQHEQSLQWQGQPSMHGWINYQIHQIKKYTDRKIVFRPHPRWPINPVHKDLQVVRPRKIQNDAEVYDNDFHYHCVINHNSGPSVYATLEGVPVICDSSSLAFPVSENIENIENPRVFDREEWLVKLSHTEWTVDEIQCGVPLMRLIPELQKRLC